MRMKFLADVMIGMILAGLAVVTIAAIGCTFAPVPDVDATGAGALGGGCAVAFAILMHGAMARERAGEGTDKGKGRQGDE